MDFNGTDEFLNLGVATIPDTTDFTMTVWCNLNTFTGGSSHAIIHLGDNDSPNNGTRLYIKRGTDPGRIGLYDPDAAANDFSAAVAVTANQWDLAAIRGTKASAGGGGDVTPLGSWVKVVGMGESGAPGGNGDDDDNPITGTVSEVGTDDTDRIMIVVLSHEQNPPNEPTAVTYGGQSMTEGASNSTSGSGGRDHDISIWWLNEVGIQAASTNVVSSTWATPSDERRGGMARFFTNVDQSSPIANVEGVDSTTLEILVFSSVTTAAGNLHFITANQTNNTGYTSSSLDGLTNGNTTGFGYYSPGYSIGVAIGTSDGSSQTKSITCPGSVNRHGGVGLTLVKSGGGGGSTVALLGSWLDGLTHTNESGTNRLFVVFVAIEDVTTAEVPTSVTYRGETMTSEHSASVTAMGLDVVIRMYWIIDADIENGSGTTIVVNYSSAPNDDAVMSAFFENVDQADPTGNQAQNTSVDAVDPVTLSTSAAISSTSGNDLIVGGLASGRDGSTYAALGSSGFTDGVKGTGGVGGCSGFTIHKTSTGSDTPGIVISTDANRQSIIGVQLNAASGGGSVDVSVNGGTWTNLITGTTTGLELGTVSHQSIGHTLAGGSFSNWVDGSLADIRMYDRQLNQAEIQTLYAARGKDGIVEGLLARYPLKGIIGAEVSSYGTVTSEDSFGHGGVAYSATAITLDFGARSTQTGDLLIALVGNGNEATGDPGDSAVAINMTADETGWTLRNSGQHETAATVGGTLPTVYIFTRYAKTGTEATYGFTAASGCNMVAIALVYRSASPLIFGTSVYSTGTSDSALSPAGTIQGDNDLVLNVALIDDFGNTPITFDPKTLHQSSIQGSVDPNGCILAVAEYLNASSSPTRQWSHGSDQWAALTLNWYANEVVEISGSTGHPHIASSAGGPTFIETNLRI